MGKVKVTCLTIAVAVLAVSASAQRHSVVKPNPSFNKMKTLAGAWEGMMVEGNTKIPSRAVFNVVSDGSVVMQNLAPGTPHEMITMFHTDGSDLLATHYCAAHNQPRMKLVPGKNPNVLFFDFMDGTNIAPGDTHMQSVKITFIDADHHYEDWSSNDNGKIITAHFVFQREKI